MKAEELLHAGGARAREGAPRRRRFVTIGVAAALAAITVVMILAKPDTSTPLWRQIAQLLSLGIGLVVLAVGLAVMLSTWRRGVSAVDVLTDRQRREVIRIMRSRQPSDHPAIVLEVARQSAATMPAVAVAWTGVLIMSFAQFFDVRATSRLILPAAVVVAILGMIGYAVRGAQQARRYLVHGEGR